MQQGVETLTTSAVPHILMKYWNNIELEVPLNFYT